MIYSNTLVIVLTIMTRSTIKHMNSRNKEGKGGYASVNGLNMYYEVHGTGRPPLVLLHGASRRRLAGFDDSGVPRRADAGGQVIGLQTKGEINSRGREHATIVQGEPLLASAMRHRYARSTHKVSVPCVLRSVCRNKRMSSQR